MECTGRTAVSMAFIAGIILAVFLLVVTVGAASPSSHQAALSQPTSAEDPAPSSQEFNPADTQGIANVNPIDCALSQDYPASILQWCDLITYYSSQRSIEPNLLAALILQESAGDAFAYSHSGAVGLMQVMPRDGLAASFVCLNGPCFQNRPTIAQLQDPEFNIAYGTNMLAGLVQKYGDVRDALKSYGPMDVGYAYSDKVLALFNHYKE